MTTMAFELVPILDQMSALYEKPISVARFQDYLRLLTGGRNDNLELAIGAYNPMAKAHVPAKLNELRRLNAEQLAAQVLQRLNDQLPLPADRTLKVVLNLADDLLGGWTNGHTTDFDSKFRNGPLLKRNFCTPIFWTSEDFTEEKITQRTLAYCARTIYQLQHSHPVTLAQHLAQEVFVAQLASETSGPPPDDLPRFYQQHQDSDSYHLIFNFFYGDNASASLGMLTFGPSGALPGFGYAAQLAKTAGHPGKSPKMPR
jgi:hypothetical protein